MNNKEVFLTQLEESFINNAFLRLKISKAVSKNTVTNHLTIKKVVLKNKALFNCVYNNKTQDITKNYNSQELLSVCDKIIGNDFKNAVLFTTNSDITLSYNKKSKTQITVSKPTLSVGIDILSTEGFSPLFNSKQRLIDIQNNVYLQKLGVINSNNVTVNGKVGKLKQIQKFIETLSSTIEQSSLKNKDNIKIADMGSGKGYLSFAVYDYIKNSLQKDTQLEGIEFREDMVEKCNTIAGECNFGQLKFTQGTIQDTKLIENDILIALHACDTATDDAIYKGITSNSEIIILSPCCHKQIRKEISQDNVLSDILSHGIFKERQSEMITDTLRGLILELHGYKTKIFEYISDQHTHKNIMIVGIKHSNKIDTEKISEKIQDLKKTFGIKNFYLEDLFN